MKALATDLIDSVQVVYNIFDQNPEDELFPECERRNIAVIARVPFDEGSLTGTLTPTRHGRRETSATSISSPRTCAIRSSASAQLRPLVPEGMTLPELALRHILQEPAVSTVIPGMRKLRHVEANLRASDTEDLPDALMAQLQGAPVGPMDRYPLMVQSVTGCDTIYGFPGPLKELL